MAWIWQSESVYAWTRQVGRRQISSITLAGGRVGFEKARSLRAATGSTGHRYGCSHCPITEKKSTPLPCHPIVEKVEDAGCWLSSHRLLFATLILVTTASERPGVSREKNMRPPRAPASSQRR